MQANPKEFRFDLLRECDTGKSSPEVALQNKRFRNPVSDSLSKSVRKTEKLLPPELAINKPLEFASQEQAACSGNSRYISFCRLARNEVKQSWLTRDETETDYDSIQRLIC